MTMLECNSGLVCRFKADDIANVVSEAELEASGDKFEVPNATCSVSLDAVSLNRETSGVQHASAFPPGLLDGGICVGVGMRAGPVHFVWTASSAANRRTRKNFRRGRDVYLDAGVLSPPDRGLQSGTTAGLFGRGLASPRRAHARGEASRLPDLALAVGQAVRLFLRVAGAGDQSPDQSVCPAAMAAASSHRTVWDSSRHDPSFSALWGIFPDALPVAAFRDRLAGLQLPDRSSRIRYQNDCQSLRGIVSAKFDRGDLGTGEIITVLAVEGIALRSYV